MKSCRIGAAFIFLLMLVMTFAHADSTLTHMVGKVLVHRLDGTTERGSVGKAVFSGETVGTGSDGFVRMKMTDGGWMVLPPNSQLRVEKYVFVEDKPAEDSFVFRVLKGGLRTASGYIGKRGNINAYSAKTVTATIGIRGTEYDMRVCEQNNCGEKMPDGTYVLVKKGAVEMSGDKGRVDVKAGQVAQIMPAKPPVILPYDPGVGFTPPPSIQKANDGPPSPFQGTWTGRVQSAFFTSPAVVEIFVSNGVITGKSSWNTKASPPEPFSNAKIRGDTLTYNYPASYDIGKATLKLDGESKIRANFVHGTSNLEAEFTRQ